MFNFKFQNSLLATFFQVLELYKHIKSEVSAEAVREIDLSNPAQEEAQLLLNLHKYGAWVVQTVHSENIAQAVNYILGAEALAFVKALVERIEPIQDELAKVANGTATPQDFEELEWQNTIATQPETAKNALTNSVSALSQDSFAELWDNEEDNFWDKYAVKA